MPNNFTVYGNVVRDPEVRSVGANGTKLCRFTVADNVRQKNRETGEWENVPIFFDFECWGKDAEFVEGNFQKGSPIAVAASEATPNNWVDQQGNKRSKVVYKTYMGAIRFAGYKKSKKEEAEDEDKHAIAAMDSAGGEIPF